MYYLFKNKYNINVYTIPLSNALDVPLSTSNVKEATTSACLAMIPALSTASAPMEVINWVPLIKAKPSLAPKWIGVKLWLSSTYLASPQPVWGLHMWPSPIKPKARCDKGARSPEAPTVPCSGTHGRHDAVIEKKWHHLKSKIK